MVTKWTKLNLPWFEIDEFSDVVVDKIPLLDILDHWKIEYAPCASGEFTHRMKCPLPIHAEGQERTASCYVSQAQNKFYCFGCNSGGNVIDFVMLYAGKPFHEAVRWLAKYAKITSDNIDDDLANLPKREKKDPEKTIAKHVFRTGILIREFINKRKGKEEYSKWCKWADTRFVELDGYLDKLEDSKWEVVKTYYDKIVNFLKSKS